MGPGCGSEGGGGAKGSKVGAAAGECAGRVASKRILRKSERRRTKGETRSLHEFLPKGRAVELDFLLRMYADKSEQEEKHIVKEGEYQEYDDLPYQAAGRTATTRSPASRTESL